MTNKELRYLTQRIKENKYLTWDETNYIIKALEQPFEQIKWERDIAIAQLKDLGYGLGEKPKTGHWIPVYQGDEIINYRCSECEHGETFGASTYRRDYCNCCGVKMVKPQESEG